jgi:hypothetical protein
MEQGRPVPHVSAIRSAVSEAVKTTAPSQSRVDSVSLARFHATGSRIVAIGETIGRHTITSRQMGRLIQKIQRQSDVCVMVPPMMGPAAVPTAHCNATTPNHLVRSTAGKSAMMTYVSAMRPPAPVP